MKHDRKKHAERAWQCLNQAIEKRDWSVAFASLKHLTLATGRVTLGQLAVGVDLLPCETCEEDDEPRTVSKMETVEQIVCGCGHSGVNHLNDPPKHCRECPCDEFAPPPSERLAVEKAKRYDLEFCDGDSGRCYARMAEDLDGDYMLAEPVVSKTETPAGSGDADRVYQELWWLKEARMIIGWYVDTPERYLDDVLLRSRVMEAMSFAHHVMGEYIEEREKA